MTPSFTDLISVAGALTYGGELEVALLGTNWVDYAGGDASGVTVPTDAVNGIVVFRLVKQH